MVSSCYMRGGWQGRAGAPGYGGEISGLEKGAGVVPVLFPPGGVGQYGDKGGQNAGVGRGGHRQVLALSDHRTVTLNFQVLKNAG